MSNVTSELLKKIFPGTKAALRDRFVEPFNRILPKYEVTDKKRFAAFIATAGIETDYLRVLIEYANGKAYEGNKGLGNTQPGDGPKFKGRGVFQTTGRSNYRRVTETLGKVLGLDFLKEPEKLAEMDIAVEAAGIFIVDNKLNAYADKGQFSEYSGIVNRGDPKKKALHYADRLTLYNLALKVVPDDLDLSK